MRRTFQLLALILGLLALLLAAGLISAAEWQNQVHRVNGGDIPIFCLYGGANSKQIPGWLTAEEKRANAGRFCDFASTSEGFQDTGLPSGWLKNNPQLAWGNHGEPNVHGPAKAWHWNRTGRCSKDTSIWCSSVRDNCASQGLGTCNYSYWYDRINRDRAVFQRDKNGHRVTAENSGRAWKYWTCGPDECECNLEGCSGKCRDAGYGCSGDADCPSGDDCVPYQGFAEDGFCANAPTKWCDADSDCPGSRCTFRPQNFTADESLCGCGWQFDWEEFAKQHYAEYCVDLTTPGGELGNVYGMTACETDNTPSQIDGHPFSTHHRVTPKLVCSRDDSTPCASNTDCPGTQNYCRRNSTHQNTSWSARDNFFMTRGEKWRSMVGYMDTMTRALHEAGKLYYFSGATWRDPDYEELSDMMLGGSHWCSNGDKRCITDADCGIGTCVEYLGGDGAMQEDSGVYIVNQYVDKFQEVNWVDPELYSEFLRYYTKAAQFPGEKHFIPLPNLHGRPGYDAYIKTGIHRPKIMEFAFASLYLVYDPKNVTYFTAWDGAFRATFCDMCEGPGKPYPSCTGKARGDLNRCFLDAFPWAERSLGCPIDTVYGSPRKDAYQREFEGGFVAAVPHDALSYSFKLPAGGAWSRLILQAGWQMSLPLQGGSSFVVQPGEAAIYYNTNKEVSRCVGASEEPTEEPDPVPSGLTITFTEEELTKLRQSKDQMAALALWLQKMLEALK